MANRSYPFVIRWRWKDEARDDLRNDTVHATTAPRAANKLIKDLGADFADVKQNIMIMSIENQKI